jgi:hypothetical protein
MDALGASIGSKGYGSPGQLFGEIQMSSMGLINHEGNSMGMTDAADCP